MPSLPPIRGAGISRYTMQRKKLKKMNPKEKKEVKEGKK
jgi:hypothetical protein